MIFRKVQRLVLKYAISVGIDNICMSYVNLECCVIKNLVGYEEEGQWSSDAKTIILGFIEYVERLCGNEIEVMTKLLTR